MDFDDLDDIFSEEHQNYCPKCKKWYGWTWDNDHWLECEGNKEIDFESMEPEELDKYEKKSKSILATKRAELDDFIRRYSNPEKVKENKIIPSKKIILEADDIEQLEELLDIAEILADDKTNEVLAKIKKLINEKKR